VAPVPEAEVPEAEVSEPEVPEVPEADPKPCVPTTPTHESVEGDSYSYLEAEAERRAYPTQDHDEPCPAQEENGGYVPTSPSYSPCYD
jgi:hypothetical protein